MKKFYAFFAAALMSISVLAAPASIPTATNLSDAGYNVNANVVLCMYFDSEACNDVILVGNYNADCEWSLDVSCNRRFAKLNGFPGWYAVEFPWKDGVYAKPIQLKMENDKEVASWDFQSGDPDAWVPMDGSKQALITLENGNESSVNYPEAGAYIYELKYWKAGKTPCVVIPKFNYTIILFEPYCEEEGKEFAPAIIGDFDSWSGTAMSKTVYEADEAYMYVLNDEYGHKIKFREVNSDGWKNQLQMLDEFGNWNDLSDYVLPQVTKDTTIIFDYSDTEKYRYTLCAPEEPAEYTVIDVLLPTENAPESVEIIGTFDDWQGTALEWVTPEGGIPHWFVELEAKASQYFKFRSAGSWDYELEVYNTLDDEWSTIGDNQLVFGKLWEDSSYKGTDCKKIELDLSDARWKAPQGIENVVLTEKAQKVVVDGAIYIIRDNKMFNIHGAQVR